MRQQLMEGEGTRNIPSASLGRTPDLELYMDQVRTLVDRYLSPVIKASIATSSMVNNYVKLGLIPAPVKKI